MAKVESLGIKRIEALHYYVHDLDRTRRFYTDLLDFAETGESTAALDAATHQHSAVFQAGAVTVVCTEPRPGHGVAPAAAPGVARGDRGTAERFLARHPDGVGVLAFEVEDAERAFALLDKRGGTPVADLQRHTDPNGGGTLATFDLATPFGDTLFRFVERRGYGPLFPGLAPHAAPQGGKNRHGFEMVDHVTTNFVTMAPALLWMEHVLGLEHFWEIEFHTNDVRGSGADHGSGLRSQVMWDPASGVRFANNEPRRPFFDASQIALFVDDHRGDGIQHAALAVTDILAAVRGLRAAGVDFMPTAGTYYDALPDRLAALGIGRIDEDHAVLRGLEVLVDGGAPGSYLLQIFLRDFAALYKEPAAGPFFYEVIQRKGDKGFGGGNFRALFESIERQQKAEGRI